MSIRNRNINLLRYLSGTHKKLATKLDGLVNWNQLSAYCLASQDIDDNIARDIEARTQKPEGWLDRDHSRLLKLTELEYHLIEKILALSKESQTALATLLDECRRKTD